MEYTEKCPVCHGDGVERTEAGFVIADAFCHGCGGIGWVEPDAEQEQIELFEK